MLPKRNIAQFDNPSMGADPEMFVKSGNSLLPAFKFLPHKDEGTTFKFNMYHVVAGKVYWDGFQAEYAFFRGESCLSLLTIKQRCALQTLLKLALKHDPKAALSLESVVKVPATTLKNEKDCYIELGCLPSMNAYDDAGIHVSNPRKLPYRFAGAHVHFGYDTELLPVDRQRVVKYLDAILAIWGVGAAQNWDNPIRRQYYGKAGEYRKPKHGLEYRTLSNFYLASPYTTQMVYEIARAVYRASKANALEMWAHDENETRVAINECDAKLSAQILKRNKAMFNWLLSFSSLGSEARKLIYEVGLHGIEHVLQDPANLRKNWDLDSESEWNYYTQKHVFEIDEGMDADLLKVQKG